MVSHNGRFLIGVSALALAVTPSVAAAQAAPAPSLSAGKEAAPADIVVQGYRQSLETAQAIKRNSNEIVDSVVAEDIGKLPDWSAAESLARITGVSVERSGGEASAVRVRGLPDLTTTYNGREIFTAEGRSVALQDFPAGTISRIDVYKTGAADLIEAGIAGEIDVRSRKPFDFKGLRVAGGVTGLHWTQSQRIGASANLLVSDRWKTGIGEIGLLVQGSYTDNNFVEAYRTDNLTIQKRGQPPVGGRYPPDVTIEYPSSTRWRPNAGAVLQWRPSADLEFYGDFLYQGFRGRGESRALHINAGSNAAASNITYCKGSTDLICQVTLTGPNAPTGYQVGQWSGTNTYQGGGGFIWKLGRTRITGDAALTDSTYTATNFQMNTQTNSTGTRVFNFDDAAGGGGGSAQILDINLADPASWRLASYNENGSQAHGRSFQARLDADVPVELSIFDKIQAGVRFSNRDTDTEDYNTGRIAAPTKTPEQLAALQFTALPFDFQAVPIGFRGDPTNHPRTWITPTRQSVIDNADLIRALAGKPAGWPSRTPRYQANEKSYAAYLQTHYWFELGSLPVDGQIGLRVVRTTDDVSGTLTVGQTTPTPYRRSNQYTDFLPNVSARIRFTPKLQGRLAFTKTRTRPSFGQLNPTLTVNANETCPDDTDPTSCYRSASGGNPELRPIKSTNYDASLEYYFSRSGSATVQIFRRDVNGFINNTTQFVDDPELGRLNINRPENGQRGRIQGVEAAFRTFFKIPSLPDWAQNFGVLMNYTYLDHGSELSPTAAATLPGMQPITNTSSHLANAQLFYETKALSLRVSYNYRSHFLRYSAVTDPAVKGTQPTLPTRQEGRGVLDISGALNPTEHLTLTFSVSNLLGTPMRTYRTFNTLGQSYPWQVRYLETIYRLGARFRF